MSVDLSAAQRAERQTSQRLQSLAHDARHSLYAVRLGIRLICDARTQGEDYAPLAEMVTRESRTLIECIEELIQMAK